MPVLKTPVIEGYESLRVKNFKADMIADILALATGLDMAIEAIKPGEITKKARKALTDVTAQAYMLFAYRIALQILKDESIAKEEAAVSDFLYRFDLPDDSHDDLILYYRFHS